MSWLTAKKFALRTKCLSLGGDMIFMPLGEVIGDDVSMRGIRGLHLAGPDGQMFATKNVTHVLMVASLWSVARNCEPPWINQLPRSLQAMIRINHTLDPDVSDTFCVVSPLRHAGIRYCVVDDGLVAKTVGTFRLTRLTQIRQFGYLTDPMVTNDGMRGFNMGFEGHNRYTHVMDVMAVATLMATNNKLSRSDRALLRIAALTHDALTPAGGDTIKMVDPPAFDEDEHYPELLKSHDASALLREHGFTEAALIETVQGRGVLGTLLDLADKVAYVSRDSELWLGRLTSPSPVSMPDVYFLIRDTVRSQPFITGIWDSVRVQDGEVFVADADRLADFLKLRLLMFRALYYNSSARFMEFLLAKVVVKFLYDHGELTRAKLLEMTDWELDRFLDDVVGMSVGFHLSWQHVEPFVETFATMVGAQRRERELISKGNPFVLIENLTGVPKPATHYLVDDGKGRIVPLAKARPDRVQELLSMARMVNPYRLYYLEGVEKHMTPGFVNALRYWRQQEMKR